MLMLGRPGDPAMEALITTLLGSPRMPKIARSWKKAPGRRKIYRSLSRAECLVKVAPGPGVARVELERPPEVGYGLVRVAGLEEGIAQAVMDLAHVRADLQRHSQVFGRLPGEARLEQGVAEVVLGDEEPGIQAHGELVLDRGLIDPVLHHEHRA